MITELRTRLSRFVIYVGTDVDPIPMPRTGAFRYNTTTGQLFLGFNDQWLLTSGSGGGAVAWGDITGDVNDQTDLIAAVLSAVAEHEAASNPHPTYLTQAEGDGLYAALGAPAAAVAAHEAAGDPHAQYLLAAEGNAAYQPLDADLTTLAASITAFGHSLVDDANSAAARTTLGLVIGTDVQAQDAELAALAGLTSAADRLPYFTGSGTAALAVFTGAARNLLDDVDADAQRSTIGAAATAHTHAWADVTGEPTTLSGYGITDAQGLDATLTALAALNATAGLVEQTGADAFTKRLIGVANATDVLTRADGDGRFAALSHVHVAADVTSGVFNHARLGTGGGGSTKFLREDGTWQTLAGGGDLLASNNLSDVANAAAALANLGGAPLASPTFTGTVNLPGTTIFAAGSASANSWPKFTAGTLLTTPEAGALELDANCLYFTTDVGNRGYVPVRHFIRCNATRTLPNDTNENAIFNSPANGRVTLETGTYLFEMLIGITSMSATNGNALLDVLGAGTATVNDWRYAVIGKDGTLVSVNAVLGVMPVIQSTPASMFTAGTGVEMWFFVSGTFTVTVAGTMIPSIDQVTAAAAVVGIGSYFMCERIGDTGVVSVGQWD